MKGIWAEKWRGTRISGITGDGDHQFNFNNPSQFNGPLLYAKQHADVGLEKFDPPGGAAYNVWSNGRLAITAYKDDNDVIRSGNIQSTNANQAYQGYPTISGENCFLQAGGVLGGIYDVPEGVR